MKIWEIIIWEIIHYIGIYGILVGCYWDIFIIPPMGFNKMENVLGKNISFIWDIHSWYNHGEKTDILVR